MAGTEIGSLYYDLNIDDKDLKGQLDNADRQVKSFGDRMGSYFSSAANESKKFMLLTAAAGAAAVAFGISSVHAYEESEKAQAQLEHAVIGVTHATQEQLKATEDLAVALMHKGVLDDDAIKLGLAQLSTFGLSNDAVRALGGSLADLAVNQFGVNATGEQLADTANMIAKALNMQFGVLEKSGIRFTDAQKHVIEFGTEMEKVNAINEGFAQNLKFTNDVALTTTEGKLAKAKVAFGNLQEGVGQVIVEAMTPFVQSLSDVIAKVEQAGGLIEYLKGVFERNRGTVLALAGAITGALVPAITALGISIMRTLIILAPFMIIGAALFYLWDKNRLLFWMLVGAIIGFATAITVAMMPAIIAATAGFGAMAIAVIAATWPFILIGIAVAALAYLVIKYFDQIKGAIMGAIDWFVTMHMKVLEAVAGIGSYLYNAGKDLIQGMINGVKDKFNDLKGAIKDAVTGSVNQVKGLLGIHSPSTVFAEIGKNVTQGFVKGINDTAGMAISAMGNLGNNVIAPAVSLGSSPNAAGAPALAAAGNNVINIGTINDKSDADYILRRMDRSQENVSRGISPLGTSG